MIKNLLQGPAGPGERRPLVACVCLLAVTGALAREPAPVTADDYARAEQFMPYNVEPLVLDDVETPTWLDRDKLWYRTRTTRGVEIMLVDARRGTVDPVFEPQALARWLSAAAGEPYAADRLPLENIELTLQDRSIAFKAAARHWRCDIDRGQCLQIQVPGPDEVLSPDRKRTVFLREDNLWLRDLTTGRETRLTSDGVRDFGYATDNEGWRHGNRPVVLWSPDSKRIATFQQDQRGVGEMYLVKTMQGHPQLEAWKYPLSGDAVIPKLYRVIIDVDPVRVVRLKMEPDARRSTADDGIGRRRANFELSDAQWSADSARLAFISTSRDFKHAQLRIADAATGAVRDVLEERSRTFYDSTCIYSVNWHYLSASNEILWYSQRDNWGHLYLYDATTGRLKNRVTAGDWNVAALLRVDERKRQLYFLGVGREAGRDPYFQHLYRAGLDGTGLKLLTPEDATHEVSIAPLGDFFIDSYSRPEVPSVTVLRDLDGKRSRIIARTDISRLKALGWQPPVPITVKARDGRTDLYGLMYKPTRFDARRKYPIVNAIYPGPHGSSVSFRRFAPARGNEGDVQSLAELGFIVVQIDGMGTPLRSKAFHDTYYGNMGDDTIPDQVAGMRELAQRYSWIDVERAGIYGISGGGYATARAMFDFPDFFKVGVSVNGNHDQASYTGNWSERFMGAYERRPDGTSNYDSQANQNVAKNLKGHLLLVHSTMDDNVPPNLTLLVVDALIKANKDFDLLMLPNETHRPAGAAARYLARRRWDYFVRYLQGTEPPKEFEMRGTPAGR